MILDCAHCRREYDVGQLEAGASVACECGDLLCVPAPLDLEHPEVVKQFVERWAASCETTADALAVEGGWEFLAGSAEVRIEHDADEASLTIRSTVMRLPEDADRRQGLFEKLLRLNYHQTGEARFALDGEEVIVTFTRPTLGLDYHEFQQAVEQVATAADDFDDELRREFAGEPPEEEADLSDDEVL